MTILVYEDGRLVVDHADPLERLDFNGLIACITNPKSGDVLTCTKSVFLPFADCPL